MLRVLQDPWYVVKFGYIHLKKIFPNIRESLIEIY